MKSSALLIIAPFITFLSCQSGTHSPGAESGPMNISIDIPEIPESEKTAPSTLFQPDQTIVLKMNPNMPLQSAGKFEKMGKHWFVLDPQQNYLFRYDSTGRMVNRIGIIGNGPGEYQEITDFSLHNDEIIIYSNNSRKIIHYDTEGNVMKELPVPYFASQIEVLDSIYILNTGASNHDILYDILILSRKGAVIDSFHNTQNTLGINHQSLGFLYKNAKDRIRFLPTFGNTVYSLGPEYKFKPYLAIDLGPDEINISEFSSMEMFINSYFKYTWISNRYFENEKLLIFYYFEDKRLKYTFYNKSKNQVLTGDQIQGEVLFKPITLLKFGYLDKNNFYSSYYPAPKDYRWIYKTIDWPSNVTTDGEKKKFIEEADALIFRYKVL